MGTKTHWLQSPNKNYLGHWDLPEKDDLILTIKSAQWEEVINPMLKDGHPDKSKLHKVVRFEEDVKPFICNQTNAQSIIKSTGCKYMEDSIGKQIHLYIGSHFDRINKEEIDCVRIRSKKPAEKPILQYNTKEYEKVLSAMIEGYSIEQIRTKWQVSKDLENKLNEEV
jgi:hypothetical protein